MAKEQGRFQCVVIAPQGKVVDCPASSVVFPCHDGFVGVMPGHLPIFCRLGMDIMKIKRFGSQHFEKDYIYLLINRGFLLMGTGLLTVTTSEAFSFEGLGAEKIEGILEKERRRLATGTFTMHQHWVENRKLTLLTRLTALYTNANRQV